MHSNLAVADRKIYLSDLLHTISEWTIDRTHRSRSKYTHHGRQVSPRRRDIDRDRQRALKLNECRYVAIDKE